MIYIYAFPHAYVHIMCIPIHVFTYIYIYIYVHYTCIDMTQSQREPAQVTKYHSWEPGSGYDAQSEWNEVGLVRSFFCTRGPNGQEVPGFPRKFLGLL